MGLTADIEGVVTEMRLRKVRMTGIERWINAMQIARTRAHARAHEYERLALEYFQLAGISNVETVWKRLRETGVNYARGAIVKYTGKCPTGRKGF